MLDTLNELHSPVKDKDPMETAAESTLFVVAADWRMTAHSCSMTPASFTSSVDRTS